MSNDRCVQNLEKGSIFEFTDKEEMPLCKCKVTHIDEYCIEYKVGKYNGVCTLAEGIRVFGKAAGKIRWRTEEKKFNEFREKIFPGRVHDDMPLISLPNGAF